MIADVQEFPCVEACRCHLTEKEDGLRLMLTKIPRKRGEAKDVYRLEFTKRRDRHTEWYVNFDTTMMEGGIAMQSASFQHVEMRKFLHASPDGIVGTQDFPSNWTTWLMEPVESTPIMTHSEELTLTRSRSGSLSWDGGSFKGTSPVEMAVSYSLLPKAFANRKLTHTTEKNGGGLQLEATTTGGASVWELEFTSGELCYISNPVLHCQVRCNLFGQLSLSHMFQGWEVFRFIEVGSGNVAISSWTHSHKYLSSDPDGRVFTSENRLGHWEKWKLEKAENGVYIISVAHRDRYLTVGKDKDQALQTTMRPSDFCKWHINAAHSNIYYLSSVGSQNSLHLSSRTRGPFLSKHKREWEEWKLDRTTNGDITLWSKAHEKFLGCNSNGELHTTSTQGDWSLWEIEASPHGGIYIKSKAHECTLSVQNGILCTTRESLTEAQTFRLEPRLPPTISGSRLAALGAAGALGVALTIAMPYAVLGAMEAAGLAATELSILAGISVEALAGAGGGAILGAGLVGTTAAVVNDSTDDRNRSPSAEIRDDLIGICRPICAWKRW